MKARTSVKWGIAVAGLLIVSLVMSSAWAQGPRGRRGPGMRGPGMHGPGMRGPGMFGRMMCDVEGLWFTATFEAKLSDAELAKLKPVCQKAADAREKEMLEAAGGTPRDRMLALKRIGDTMEKEAKAALGADASKLDKWFKRRDEMTQRMEERMSHRRFRHGLRMEVRAPAARAPEKKK